MFSGKSFHFGTLCVELVKRLSYLEAVSIGRGFQVFLPVGSKRKGASKRPFRVFLVVLTVTSGDCDLVDTHNAGSHHDIPG